MTVKVGSIAETVQTKARLLSLFSHLHNGENDIDIIAPEEVLREKESTQRVLNLVLICIAAISLLVGGIGVMNIMLANIMERVSEIGLRRAIGARQKDIRNQFLTEAIVICCVGGIIGVALGYATAFAVAYFAGYPAAFAWVSVFVDSVYPQSWALFSGICPLGGRLLSIRLRHFIMIKSFLRLSWSLLAFLGCQDLSTATVSYATAEITRGDLVFSASFYGELQPKKTESIYIPPLSDLWQVTIESVKPDGTVVKKETKSSDSKPLN